MRSLQVSREFLSGKPKMNRLVLRQLRLMCLQFLCMGSVFGLESSWSSSSGTLNGSFAESFGESDGIIVGFGLDNAFSGALVGSDDGFGDAVDDGVDNGFDDGVYDVGNIGVDHGVDDGVHDGVDGVDDGVDHVVVRGSLDGIHDGPDTVSLRASDGSHESSDVQHCGDSDGVKDSPVVPAPHPSVQVVTVDESIELELSSTLQEHQAWGARSPPVSPPLRERPVQVDYRSQWRNVPPRPSATFGEGISIACFPSLLAHPTSPLSVNGPGYFGSHYISYSVTVYIDGAPQPVPFYIFYSI